MVRFILFCLSFSLPASAQLDSRALRAKFGTPLNRETYHLRQGFDLTVDYGAGNQVCKLEVPANGPFNSRQQIQDFLADLVPDSMRGKELGRLIDYAGGASAVFIEYEHVTISETPNETITVSFHKDDCRPTKR